MENTAMAGRLVSLAQLEQDLMRAYEEAVNRLDKGDKDIHDHLALYLNDHALHAEAIATGIVELGGRAPETSSRRGRGRAAEEIVPLTGISGTAGALKAMRQNEVLINRAYAGIVSDSGFPDFPDDIREQLMHNLDDEKHHLEYMESALKALAVAAV
ncbi:MAG: hypothetical protein ACYC5N_10815 [Endomicrobiales bacterium]